MHFPGFLRRWALSFAAVAACVPAAAQNVNAPASLTWVPGSSVKLEQLLGDKDWATGTPTTSQTITRYDVEGTDIGCSFEDQGKLVFLFGDTLGTKVKYQAHDTMAWSTSTDPEAGLLLNFFTNSDGSTLLVEPPGIKMGPFDVPNAGISLPGGTYIVCNTGSDTSLANVHAHDYSVLTRFDETKGTFITGRTISRIPGGHFVITSLHPSASDVLMFGLGECGREAHAVNLSTRRI